MENYKIERKIEPPVKFDSQVLDDILSIGSKNTWELEENERTTGNLLGVYDQLYDVFVTKLDDNFSFVKKFKTKLDYNLFNNEVKQRKNKRLYDHITNCYLYTHNFEDILKYFSFKENSFVCFYQKNNGKIYEVIVPLYIKDIQENNSEYIQEPRFILSNKLCSDNWKFFALAEERYIDEYVLTGKLDGESLDYKISNNFNIDRIEKFGDRFIIKNKTLEKLKVILYNKKLDKSLKYSQITEKYNQYIKSRGNKWKKILRKIPFINKLKCLSLESLELTEEELNFIEVYRDINIMQIGANSYIFDYIEIEKRIFKLMERFLNNNILDLESSSDLLSKKYIELYYNDN